MAISKTCRRSAACKKVSGSRSRSSACKTTSRSRRGGVTQVCRGRSRSRASSKTARSRSGTGRRTRSCSGCKARSRSKARCVSKARSKTSRARSAGARRCASPKGRKTKRGARSRSSSRAGTKGRGATGGRKKGRMNCYAAYLKAKLADKKLTKENFAETMRQLSAAWRNMSDQEKDRYRSAAAAAKPGSAAGTDRAKTTGHARHCCHGGSCKSRRPSATSTAYRARSASKKTADCACEKK